MANTASNKRRIRNTKRKTEYNTHISQTCKTLLKQAHKALATKSPDVDASVARAIRHLDKAQQKNLLHRNNVARKKSHLQKQLNTIKQSS
jgi:small subunit ribosomal protein S20